MAIRFFIQSQKDPAPIYVGISSGRKANIRVKTNLLVNPVNFANGKIKLTKISGNLPAERKTEILEYNDTLNNLQTHLDNLRSLFTKKLNHLDPFQIIDNNWALNLINNSNDIPSLPQHLSDYFQFYLDSKKSTLRHSTHKKLNTFRNRLLEYEQTNPKILISHVDKKFALSLQRWCDKANYAHNTTVKTIKVISSVCNHAGENGLPTHPELKYITKGLKYHKTEHIHLNLREIEKISVTTIENPTLDIARDWLVISCYTAQRVSDFLRFTSEDVIEMEGMKFLDISQEKTRKSVYIPLNDEVVKILDKRNGNFPPIFSDNPDSNKALYNRYIKEVCKLAELDYTVTVYRKDKETNRYELKRLPKYEAVSTHIGRRSFATNYYGKINTALLISATGHSSESQFLRYVGKTANENALALAKAMRQLAEMEGNKPTMKVIKTGTE